MFCFLNNCVTKYLNYVESKQNKKNIFMDLSVSENLCFLEIKRFSCRNVKSDAGYNWTNLYLGREGGERGRWGMMTTLFMSQIEERGVGDGDRKE